MKTKQKNTGSRQASNDTSRTSSEGRKLASGGTTQKKKGNPEMNEDSNSPTKPGNARAGR